MPKHERELLKWVAEELLGWVFPGETDSVTRMKAERFAFEKLQSWHGIGLVVEKMWQRKFFFDLWKRGDWHAEFHEWEERKGKIVAHDEPWFAVYEAARKAVTND